MPPTDASLDALLEPLRRDPERSAVLLDVDGVLAPIVAQPDDAHMPETTRRPLIEVARRYGTVACVSGRRASDARRIVSLGSIAYLGNHGSEVLRPGAIAPELDRELQAWTRRIQGFMRDAYGEELKRLRVRLEDKEAIAALHWRGVPDEEGAEAAIRAVAERAEAAGYRPTGAARCSRSARPCGSTRAPGSSACCATPTSPPRSTWATTGRTSTRSTACDELVEMGRLGTALRVGVRSDEGPQELEEEADVMVDGTDGVRDAPQGPAGLTAPCGSSTSSRRRSCSARGRRRSSPRSPSPACAARTTPAPMEVAVGWWLLAALIGGWLGRRNAASPPIARLLADARMQMTLPELRPGLTLLNRLWPLLFSTLGAGDPRRLHAAGVGRRRRASRSSGRSPGGARRPR